MVDCNNEGLCFTTIVFILDRYLKTDVFIGLKLSAAHVLTSFQNFEVF